MATYGGWTEVREYRVWMAEDTYAVVSVDRHKNGWFMVYTDGMDESTYKTRSESDAFRHAETHAEALIVEAQESCNCVSEGWDDCADASTNVYDAPHGVRMQVVDELENRDITGEL